MLFFPYGSRGGWTQASGACFNPEENGRDIRPLPSRQNSSVSQCATLSINDQTNERCNDLLAPRTNMPYTCRCKTYSLSESKMVVLCHLQERVEIKTSTRFQRRQSRHLVPALHFIFYVDLLTPAGRRLTRLINSCLFTNICNC